MNQKIFLSLEDIASVYDNEILLKNLTFTLNEFLTEMKKALPAQLKEER